MSVPEMKEMTTHRLAAVFADLSKMLRKSPDVPVGAFFHRMSHLKSPDTGTIAVNLSTLAELSEIDKRQWMAVIREYDLPIRVRDRDASRDVLGKMLKYLEANPEARARLKRPHKGTAADASPALMKALSILIKDKGS